MQAAAVHPVAGPQRRFLFEDATMCTDARATLVAAAASLLLHVPLFPLVGLWAPPSREGARERNVTAFFEAIVEAERIVPVDLETLGCDQPATVSAGSGPAPGAVRLSESPRARGTVSTDEPERRQRLKAGELSFCSRKEGAEGDAGGTFELSSRVPAPEEVLARAGGGGGGGSGLTPEQERLMRAKWFAWYRSILTQKLHAAYPRAQLEARGIRGSLAFRLELAPNGSVKSCRITQADAPAMKDALKTTLDTIGRFPPYAATGLTFFPPFNFMIPHGSGQWRSSSAGHDRPAVCAVVPAM